MAEAYLRTLRNYPVSVHILGPGLDREKSPLSMKRLQVRDEIARQFPNSNVYFSEDPDLHSTTNQFDNLLDEIVFHAALADVVLCLVGRGTTGVLLEIAHLSSMASVAQKLFVIIDEIELRENAMVRAAVTKLGTERYFSKEDLEECNLTRTCCKIVMSRVLHMSLN